MRKQLKIVVVLLTGLVAPAAVLSAQDVPLRLVRDLVLDAPSSNFPPRRFLVADNGDMIVATRRDNALLIFDNTGKLKRSIGVGDDSAGWFGVAPVIGRVGDSIWAHDETQSRTTFLTLGNYDFARVLMAFPSVRLSSGDPMENSAPTQLFSRARGLPTQMTTYPVGMRDTPSGFLGDGTVLTEWTLPEGQTRPDWVAAGPEAGLHPLRVDTSGVFQQLIASYPNTPTASCLAKYTAPHRRGEVGGVNCPPQFAELSSDGSLLALVQQDNHLPPGSASTSTVRAVRSDGRVIFSREFNYIARAYPEADLKALVTSRQTIYARDTLLFLAFSSIPVPPTYYPVGLLRTGEDGTVWFLHQSRWMGLDQRGNSIGSFSNPRATTLLAITKAYAWIGENNGTGGSPIVRYRIER